MARIIPAKSRPTKVARDLPITSSPKFPSELAWRYPLNLYLEGVGPYTESPDEFHFGAALSCIGIMMGRRRFFRYPTPHFPNFFVCLVGPTAASKKTTAMGLARAEILAPFLDADRKAAERFHVEYSIGGSGEGILAKLADTDDMTGGSRMLLYMPEFSGLLRKMKQKDSTLHSLLLQAADAEPTMSLPTRRRPLTVSYATIGLLAGSTASWLAADLSEDDIKGGLVNRILWFYGDDCKPSIDLPERMDDAPLRQLRQELRKIVAIRPIRRSEQIYMSAAGREVWKPWYEKVRNETPLGDTVGAITARRHSQAIRLALFYAALDSSTEILPVHVEAATAVADFCAQVVAHLFLTISPDQDAKAEREILNFLLAAKKAAGDKPAPRKIKMTHQLSASRISTDRFIKLLKGLIAAGYVRCDWNQGLVWAT